MLAWRLEFRKLVLFFGLACAVPLTHGCGRVDVAKLIEQKDLPLEIWDFSEGMVAEKANWGAEGWVTATKIEDEQFKGPVYLRILLPNDRSIEGRFEFVRATRIGEAVYDVSLFLPALEADAARDRLVEILESADDAQGPENQRRVAEWYRAGPRSGPGEQLNLLLSDEEDALRKRVGVNVNWVWAPGRSDGLWNINISLSDETALDSDAERDEVPDT